MNRRRLGQWGVGMGLMPWLALGRPAAALTLGDLTGAEAGQGLSAALEQGADAAIALLGRNDGFLGNPQVRIGLPGQLDDAAKLMSKLGQGKRVDELVTAINRAAEAAVPQGRDVLLQAVRSISVTDAKQILTGGDTAVTDFFAGRTRAPLTERFLPLVSEATQQVDLARYYNTFAERAARFGLVKGDGVNLQQYVTGKTLDGLYFVIGEEERKIRQNPVAAGSRIVQKVFGALR